MKKKVTKKETEPKKTTRKTRAKTATTKKKAATKKTTQKTKDEPTREPILAEPTHEGITMSVPTPQTHYTDAGVNPVSACADPTKKAAQQFTDSACKPPAHEGISFSAPQLTENPVACSKPFTACAEPVQTTTPPANLSACKSPDPGSACIAPSHQGISGSVPEPPVIPASDTRPGVACAAFSKDPTLPLPQSASAGPGISSACKAPAHEGISLEAKQPCNAPGLGTSHSLACKTPPLKKVSAAPKHDHPASCAKPAIACFNPATACSTPTPVTACASLTPIHACAACTAVHACAACLPISACSACYSCSPVVACGTPQGNLQRKWKKHNF